MLWKTSFGFIWDILNFLKICKFWVWAQIRRSKLLLWGGYVFRLDGSHGTLLGLGCSTQPLSRLDGSQGPLIRLGDLRDLSTGWGVLGGHSLDWGDPRDLSTGWGVLGGPLFWLVVSLGPVFKTRHGLGVLLESNPGLWILVVVHNCPGRLLGPHHKLLGFLGPGKGLRERFKLFPLSLLSPLVGQGSGKGEEFFPVSTP